jgi:hypothetical protein
LETNEVIEPPASLRQEHTPLQEPVSPEFRYASFIVRVWRKVNSAVEDAPYQWLGEIEHLQSGRRWKFETLDDVPELLRRQTVEFPPE